MLASLTNRIGHFGANWARKRQGVDDTAGVSLERRRIYILPTRYGAIFGFVLFAMLLGSINYGANLAYALTFLLAGLVLVLLHHCHNNLLRLHVRFAGAEPVYAGDAAIFRIVITNNAAVPRQEIEVAMPPASNLPLDLQPGETLQTRLAQPSDARGWLKLQRFNISTSFPATLFRAWTWVHMDARCLVYPRPATASLPLPSSGDGSLQKNRIPNDDADFYGLREASASDSPNRIAWKAYARNNELLVKQFSGGAGTPTMLEWDAVPIADTEDRISQLARWCLDAHAERRGFGLLLPDAHIPLGSGHLHLHECLTALALTSGKAK